MTGRDCTACTAATVDTLRTLRSQISEQHTNFMLHGFNVQALAGLLDMLADRGYKNAVAAKDDASIEWWVQAQYIAAQLATAGDGIEAAGDAIEQLEHCLYRAAEGDRQAAGSGREQGA